MSTKNQLYDSMKPLFGLENDDNRIRLYLDILRGEFDKKKPFVLTDEMPQLINENFTSRDTTKPDKEIHSEWADFKAALLVSLQKSATTTEVLNKVKKLNGESLDPQSDLRFQQNIIKAHFNIYGPDDITNNISSWSAATKVDFDLTKFNNIMKNINDGGAATTNVKQFGFKLNKYLIKLMMEEAASTPSHGTDKFWESTDVQKDVYYRLASNRDSLYTTDKNGNRVDVSNGSKAVADLENDKCLGTKVKENSTQTCTEYLTKCINGKAGDIKNCKDFMLKPDFWEVVRKEVDEMLPFIAEKTLNTFGFKIISKNNINEYEDIGAWSKGLINKGLDGNELKQIRDNDKLMIYLNMLVQKVNSNPAILNKQYNTGYKFDPVDHRNRFASWSLSARGIQPRVILKNTPGQQINIVREVNLLNNSLLSLRSSVNNRLSLVNGGFFIRGAPINFGSVPIMIGGSAIQLMHAHPSNDHAEIKEHYPLIKGLLHITEVALQTKGKALDSDTKNQIEKHLESYRNSEEKLIRAIKYADKYIDLLDVYKQYDNENILSIDHLKSFVEARERYFDKTIGKQNDLLSAIESIGASISEALDKEIKK